MEERQVSPQAGCVTDTSIHLFFTTIMIGNYEAAQVLELKGCEYSNIFAFSEPTFILGFIALLVAEVFAVGLKMKEEQDLTI